MSAAAKSLVSPLDIRSQITQLRRAQPLLADMLGKLQDSLDLKDKQFRNLADATLGLLPPMLVDGSHLKRLSVDSASIKSLDAGVITTGFLAGARLAAAVIDTTKLNLKQIIVPDLVLHDNSPGAGRVAWDACSVYWNGTAYLISSGSTASPSETQIYWVIGAGAFTTAGTFVPQADRFPIATSTAGVSDVAWNKVAMSGVQEKNLNFGLITGIQIQPIASLSVVGGGSGANIVNITGYRGGLLQVAAVITTVFDGGPTLNVRYQVDGLVAVDTPILLGPTFVGSAQALGRSTGNGSIIGDRLCFDLGVGFSTSLKVDAIYANGGATIGQIDLYLYYASKLN